MNARYTQIYENTTRSNRGLALSRVLILTSTLAVASVASAVPTLQIGAPAGLGDAGTYADYIASSTDPTEKNTAFTSGGAILVAGVYGNKTQNLGSQYGTGSDWSGVNSSYTVFDGFGAVLLAAVPHGTLATALANLRIDGAAAFHSADRLSGLFPNKHAPLKDRISDFLFFSIGDFSNLGVVPNFVTETGAANGEIKTLSILGATGLDWIHFDVLALETSTQGQTAIRTTIQNNPGSKDVTWKNPIPSPGDPRLGIPVPPPLALIGLGGVLLGWMTRKSRA